jgi:RNA polymerase sigma factor (sigma-70 family)
MDDRALVKAVLAKRRGAFEALVRAHEGLCWDIVYRMVRHPEDAKDLSQDVFLKVYRYLPNFRHEASLKTWIGRIAYSVALRYLERKRIPLEQGTANEDADEDPLASHPDDCDVEQEVANDQMLGLLRERLAQLAPIQRTLLGLYHYDELSIAEIAIITELPEGTIKSHLHQGRERLRSLLLRHCGVAS